MTTTYLALGANLGDAVGHIQQAILAISTLPQTLLIKTSSLYQTTPIDASGDDYINAVIQIQTQLDPHFLLAQLQKLENQAGRPAPSLRNQTHNAPRTLDLDILLYGLQNIHSPQLTVPHPRMYARAFVLVPLHEIAPHLVSTEQLQAVSHQTIQKLTVPRSFSHSNNS